ncbi:MAG TPA: toll/interleukin-1 receptor domain-containing protein [Allosphingosinicella sp.]|jgi:hypothetical protein
MTTAFISYTHADEGLKEQFVQHLAPLRREGLISVWHDRMLKPGDHLDEHIQSELASSDLVILLVSAAFLNSEYCYEEEMRRAFARQRSGSAKVVAVILRPCQWQNVPVGDGMTLSSFLAVPKDGKPVTKWPDADEAFDDAAGAIRELVIHGSSAAVRPPERGATSSAVPNIRPPTGPTRRSTSGLLPHRVTDRDRDRYLKDAFETVAASFSKNLEDLESADPAVEADFERVDSQSFISTVYFAGKKVGTCRIFTGAPHFGDSLCLSFDAASRGSMNEWLSLEASEAGIGFKPGGMARYARSPEGLLDPGRAADYLWSVFRQHVEARAR